MKYQRIIYAEYPPGSYLGYKRVEVVYVLECGHRRTMTRKVGDGDGSHRWHYMVEAPGHHLKCQEGCGR